MRPLRGPHLTAAPTLALSLAIILGGCGTSGPTEYATEGDFWRPYGTSVALDADVPESLDELAERSTVIALGTVTSINPRPTDSDPLPEGAAIRSTVMTVDISQVIAGDEVSVAQVLLPSTSESGAPTNVPGQEFLWFLEPSGVEGYLMPASTLGIIGPVDGKLTTVLDPTIGMGRIGPNASSLEDLAKALNQG